MFVALFSSKRNLCNVLTSGMYTVGILLECHAMNAELRSEVKLTPCKRMQCIALLGCKSFRSSPSRLVSHFQSNEAVCLPVRGARQLVPAALEHREPTHIQLELLHGPSKPFVLNIDEITPYNHRV